MKAMYLKIQYWMLMKLLKWHRDFSRISSEGPPTGHYDTYWVYAAEDKAVATATGKDAESERVYLFKHSSRGHLLAQRTSGDARPTRYPREKVGPEFLQDKDWEIRHYYKNSMFMHHSVLGCFLSRLLLLFWFRWLLKALVEAVRNWVYRRKFRIIDDRVSVLRAAIELSDSGQNKFYGVHVASQIHGKRFLVMDDKRQLVFTRIDRVLDSLVADGYLDNSQAGFTVSGKTLSGLLALEQELRRERTARFSQAMMILLTAILALSSIIAVWFDYLDLENKPF